jgi:dTDP-glucose pyrophosphorylase
MKVRRSSDKAAILARGLGTRMRKATPDAHLTNGQEAVADTGVKALMPMGRPFLDYVLGTLADAGYRRICLVIGPEHDALREYYGKTLEYERLSVEFAVQEKPLGTADAVASAETFADGDFVTVINSDDYYPVEALRALRGLDGHGLAAFEREGMIRDSNIPPERVARFAVVELDNDGYLRKIIEKPDENSLKTLPRPMFVSMNCWRFGAAIFPACREIEPSARGELEITDAVQHLIDEKGIRFKSIPFELPVLDLTSRDDVAPVAQHLSSIKVKL